MESSYIQLLTGPLSALALAVILLYTVGKWAAKFVPTVVAKYMEQSDKTIEQLDKLNQNIMEHRSESAIRAETHLEATRKAIAGLHSRLNTIEPDIKEILTIKKYQQSQSINQEVNNGVQK